MFDRATFLRRGALVAAGGALATAAPASAALPTPQPAGDDQGFVQFGAVGALAARDFYAKTLGRKGLWDTADRRVLERLRTAERDRLLTYNKLLGPDGATRDQFPTTFPATAVGKRGPALAFAARLHELLGGVALTGAAFAQDPATRLLLARIAAGETQLFGAVRGLQGRPSTTGLPQPLDLDAAGPALDRLLAPSDQETPDQEPS